jgi:hypothetical protein
MTIQQKMQHVINSVLSDKKYEVTVMDDNSFKVVSGWESWFRETTSDLNSHWRGEVGKLIGIIVDNKIKKALNEV